MPTETEVIRAALKDDPEMAAKLYELAMTGKLAPLERADDSELLIVVATDNHCGIQGSLQTQCTCTRLVWLSPSTQAMLKDRGHAPTIVMCSVCFLAELERRREGPNA